MSGSSEKFCLKWNDFEQNVSSAFNDLREEKDFFDVTLVCDNNQVEAHKVIIAACSPFFKQILRRNPHQHPLLYLKGISHDDLLSVLQFMYRGEVSIAQDQLNTFLAVAEELQIKGLTQDGGGGGPARKPDPPKPRPAIKKPASLTPAPMATASTSQYQVDDDIQEVMPVKTEPGQAQHQVAQMEEAYVDGGYDDNYQYDEGYDQMADPSDVAKGKSSFFTFKHV